MALELVGGALLSAFLQVAFEKLASPQVLDFFRARKLDQKLLNKLQIKLNSIQALADDAELKQFRDPRVRDWLLRVKDAVLDAEDLLDEIGYQISKCQVEAEAESQACTGCTCKVPNFFKSSPVSSFNKEIKSRMEQVLENLEYLASQSGYLGLKNATGVAVGSGSGSDVPQKSQSTSLVVGSDICGRDEDKKFIIDWLTSDNDNPNQPSILSIVGMGGMGKTTLAQLVFNDPSIDEAKFDVKAWVCVSDDFDVFKVTRKILEAITKSADDSRDLEMVHGKLKENLTGQKFLLVLDDIWNENRFKWEAVQKPLIFGAQGSKILVTTRSKEVASTMWAKQLPLEQLQEDYCWKLFAKHAFQDHITQPNPDCKAIGMKIVEKCKGLPLALKTMGNLLRNKSTITEWEIVLKSKIWELKDSDIVPALALSYQHLPSHLKRCFAYCALFPKDYLFDKESLIRLWMAENFLQCCQQSKSLEEVGEEYFNDLLSRSFFQRSSIYRTSFVMHDLLNDLAKYVCGDICFRLEDDQENNIPKTTRHFSIATYHVKCFDGFHTSYDTERLRTFMPTSETMNYRDYNLWNCKMLLNELFSKFKFLRVLSLAGFSNLTVVPDSVGSLKYLCSLDLSNTSIDKLPESTCSLHNLQILKLNSCTDLEELPSNLHKLNELRRLELKDTVVRKFPAHLGKLKYLQVLMSSFDVGKSLEFNIRQLGDLNLRGGLSIKNLQNVENPSDALAVDLKNKTHLVELKLKWDSEWSPDDSMRERDAIVIENLQPSKHLEKLSVSSYGGKQFPRWLFNNSSLNMVSLTLENCQWCQQMPPLGLLPFLKDLRIDGLNGIFRIGTEFYGNSSSAFTSLEILEFWHMKEWETWECQSVSGAFPCLRDLSIVGCPKLKGQLPEQLVCLQTLNIRDCKQLASSAPMAPEIRELSLGDCGKVQLDDKMTSLKRLSVRGESMDASLMEKIVHIISVSSLEKLLIDSFPNMNIIPLICRCQGFLVELTISGCGDSLVTFPLDMFPLLRQLDLRKCGNIKRISQENTHSHLQYLSIRECPEFESLPEGMHVNLPSLDSLKINDCPKLELFPEGGLPSNLRAMRLYGSWKLMSLLKRALGANHSLERLGIGRVDVESLPEEGLLPQSLTTLWIEDCENLKRLDNKGLCHLSSLKYLLLKDCPNLQCLPEEGLPKSIKWFEIGGNCPMLKQRCRKPDGEDWPKIANIETVEI